MLPSAARFPVVQTDSRGFHNHRIADVPRKEPPALAKLSSPRLTRVVARERLFQRLDACLEHAHVWLSGMPGAGKTTLVASYLGARQRNALWYQVDAGDADPAVFCHFLQRIIAPRAKAAEAAPAVLEFASDLHAFGRHFFRSFYAGLGVAPVLVLDNCQEALGFGAFRKLLLEALREAPAAARVIVASRTTPPRELSRLHANGLLETIAAEELMFSEDEACALIRVAADGNSVGATQDVSQLHRLTRGWAAGLKLLLQSRVPSGLVSAQPAGAADRGLFDYLAAEVFERQPAPVRDLLLKLASLPRMSRSVAEKLTGHADAGQVLDAMQRDNNFTYLHGAGANGHYEFHPLLREFLRERARASFAAEAVAALATRAAAVLEADGQADVAAHLLIEQHQWDPLRRLIQTHAPDLLARGWHRTLGTWLEALPQTDVAADPWLCSWRGSSLAPFDLPAARRWFGDAYVLFRSRSERHGAFFAWSAVVETIAMEWADFSLLDHWLDESRRLLGESPEGAPQQLAGRFTAGMLSALLFRRPDDPSIHPWAERLLAMIEACPDPAARVLLGCNLQIYYGICVGANAKLDRLLNAVEPPVGATLNPVAGTLLHVQRAMHRWWRTGNADRVIAEVEAGRNLAREHGIRIWDFLLEALEVYAWLNSGAVGKGMAGVERLKKLANPQRMIEVAHADYLACLAALLAGDPARALTHIDAANALAERYGGPQQHALGELARAQVMHALRRSGEAGACLARGRRIAEAMQSPILNFQADLCEALFAFDGDDETRCAASLQRAFGVGATQDYLNYNYFRPDIMARLCAFALERGIEPEYARHLVRERHLRPPGPQVEAWPWSVKVFTLGRFGLLIDGKPASDLGKAHHKPVELLQAMIALGGREVSITSVVERLWPEAESKGGRGAFEATLLRLRRLLRHEQALHLEAGRLTLNPALCWVDAWSLSRALGKTRALLRSPRPPEAAALRAAMESVLRLYRGEFLQRETLQAWMLPLRNRLRNQFEEALAEAASRLEAERQREVAASFYRRAIEIDPLAEGWYRRLMACLRDQGEIAAALRVYTQCAQALASGLGARPGAETEALRRSLDAASHPDRTQRGSAPQ